MSADLSTGDISVGAATVGRRDPGRNEASGKSLGELLLHFVQR